jgi:hypothetical protein
MGEGVESAWGSISVIGGSGGGLSLGVYVSLCIYNSNIES